MALLGRIAKGDNPGLDCPPRTPHCTFNVVVPLTPAEAAVMVVAPVPVLVASPRLLMIATPVTEELQATELEMSCVVASSKVPVAANCCVRPSATTGLTGETAMDTSFAPVAVSPALPVSVP